MIFATMLLTFATALELRREPRILLTTLDAPADARQPHITIIESTGEFAVTFATPSTVYCATAGTLDTSFRAPVKVGDGGVLALGMRRGPRIAATEDALVITAIGGPEGRGKDGDVLAWRSTDRGLTWSAPVKLDDVPAAAREGLHDLAALSSGVTYCAWTDMRSGEAELFGAYSADGGATWQKNARIYRSPSKSICPCCPISTAIDASGAIFVQWRNLIDGARDIHRIGSRDQGATFGGTRKLGSATWKLDACPMDGGDIAANGVGEVASVWRRESELYCTDAASPERRIATGEQGAIAFGPRGVWIAWSEKRGGAIYLAAPKSETPRKLCDAGSDVVLAGWKSGVAAAWEEQDGDKVTLRVVRILDP